MVCYLCSCSEYKKIHNGVRDNDTIDVLKCNDCGLVYLSSIEHINDEFYEESGMLNGEVNLKEYRKNSFKDDQRRFDFLKEDLVGKSVLDFGCGAGGFLSLAKDIAEVVNGVELDKTINRALNMNGIVCFDHISKIEGKYDYITLFHVLEHIPDPSAILKELQSFLKDGGKIIIEIPSADDALLTLYESEAFKKFTYWSCHLYLYNPFTLQKVCENAGLKVNYVKQIQRYELANHLYWLAKDKPGGHKNWQFMSNPILDSGYESMLASIGKCDTLICECVVNKN